MFFLGGEGGNFFFVPSFSILNFAFLFFINLACSLSFSSSLNSKVSKANRKFMKNVLVFKYSTFLFSSSRKYAYNIFARWIKNCLSMSNNNTSLKVLNIFNTRSISSISSPLLAKKKQVLIKQPFMSILLHKIRLSISETKAVISLIIFSFL